ncbi:unnamed protein product [Vitrella brassicaformis CCMP3155]|uniref:Uncharacterized protein n=1 Tax=Vitrella brassicaformis (strain CCMP3155) TaxID=1169540 RepID=A0A0G4EWY1_VITBC|nr:unnamed protein product [Vitrella brassicaformis CCMP3155]|eukprot:CEM02589.1 unnamed protein product [Vitrella brassicaformis CCMP3155]
MDEGGDGEIEAEGTDTHGLSRCIFFEREEADEDGPPTSSRPSLELLQIPQITIHGDGEGEGEGGTQERKSLLSKLRESFGKAGSKAELEDVFEDVAEGLRLMEEMNERLVKEKVAKDLEVAALRARLPELSAHHSHPQDGQHGEEWSILAPPLESPDAQAAGPLLESPLSDESAERLSWGNPESTRVKKLAALLEDIKRQDTESEEDQHSESEDHEDDRDHPSNMLLQIPQRSGTRRFSAAVKDRMDELLMKAHMEPGPFTVAVMPTAAEDNDENEPIAVNKEVQTETEETREEPAATHTQPQLQPQPCGDRNAPLRAYLAHRQELLQTLRRTADKTLEKWITGVSVDIGALVDQMEKSSAVPIEACAVHHGV